MLSSSAPFLTLPGHVPFRSGPAGPRRSRGDRRCHTRSRRRGASDSGAKHRVVRGRCFGRDLGMATRDSRPPHPPPGSRALGTTVFGFIQVMTEYAIVIRFSDANWDSPPGTGYLTVATITISATRCDQFRHRGTAHPSRGRSRAAVSEAHRACARAGAHDRRGRARAPACSERPADPRSSQTLVQVPQSSERKNSPRFRVIETRPPGFTSPLAMSELNPPLSSFIFSQ